MYPHHTSSVSSNPARVPHRGVTGRSQRMPLPPLAFGGLAITCFGIAALRATSHRALNLGVTRGFRGEAVRLELVQKERRCDRRIDVGAQGAQLVWDRLGEIIAFQPQLFELGQVTKLSWDGSVQVVVSEMELAKVRDFADARADGAGELAVFGMEHNELRVVVEFLWKGSSDLVVGHVHGADVG